MREIRFAQLSDLHLGARLSGGRLAVPEERAEVRRRDLRGAFVRFIETALAEKVDLVLLPGDLFDTPEPSPQDVDFLIGQVNRLDPIPVVLAAGNHDPYSRTSIYNTRSAIYAERPATSPRWGAHVHLLTKATFETIELDGVRVTGCAYHHDTPLGHGPFEDLPRPKDTPDDVVNILFFHGALHIPGLTDADEPACNPFTPETLADAAYDYAAVGHYHSWRLIRDDAGRLLGAYAGAPVALAAGREGDHGFLIGRLGTGRSRAIAPENLRFVRADPRRIQRVEVDVTGLRTPEALAGALDDALRPVADQDLLHLILAGRHAPGSPPEVPSRMLERFFHVVVEDASVSDYAVPFGQAPPDEAARDAATLFKHRMMARYREASSDEERNIIEEATRMGLDAFERDEGVTFR